VNVDQSAGHKGIFTRGRHTPSWGPTNKHGGPLYKLTPSGFAGRLVIQQRFGPSIYKIVNVPKTLEKLTFDAGEYADRQIASQLRRFLGA
jgi:hypothetical protein